MDPYAKALIDGYTRRIEELQAKRETALKKERERKAKAQEKWKAAFIKDFIKGVAGCFGEDYEETVPPELLSKELTLSLSSLPEGKKKSLTAKAVEKEEAKKETPKEEGA